MENVVQELLKRHASSDHAFEQELSILAERFGDAVYKELFLQLTGKCFDITTSKHYWLETVLHRNRIKNGAPHHITIRAALFDLLSNMCSEFKNPVFTEFDYLESLRLSSITDGLTGLYNQTYFKKILLQKFPMGRRADESVGALILLDIDHFKQYNDRCGHLAGDDALRTVARIIREQIREYDIAARYGGEEFAVYLPNASVTVAHTVAERIRSVVETEAIPGQELLDSKCLTISGGLAVFSTEAEDAKRLIELADKELYRAKQRRNSVSPSNYERRKEMRHPTQSLLEITLSDQLLAEAAIVCDFSNSGVGIWSNIPVSPFDRLDLKFKKPFWSDELHLTGKVRQVVKAKDSDLNYLGIEFEQQLEDCTRYVPKHLLKKATLH